MIISEHRNIKKEEKLIFQMSECFKCGISDSDEKLYNAISPKGIVKVCKKCAVSERLPIIKKPTESQITESKRYRTVQERLALMTNQRVLNKEVTLRDLIDKKFKAGNPHPDLIDNFHWTIQRIKRARRITREQFAKAIGESEATVRMIEQGFLPEDNYKIISKIESYFGINLRKPGTSGFPNTEDVPKRFSLEPPINPNKEEQARGNPEKDDFSWEHEYNEEELVYGDPEYLDNFEED